MQKLDAFARLSLCVELCLDTLQQEALRSRSLGSAVDKEERTDSAADEETGSLQDPDRASGWLADAFVAVVLDFDAKLPFYDQAWPLDAIWRLHLATAREEVSEGRRAAIDNWASSQRNRERVFRSMDVFQATHLPQLTHSKSVLERFWKETVARGTCRAFKDVIGLHGNRRENRLD